MTPTPFIATLEPGALKDWEHGKSLSEQRKHIHTVFRDAMEVREKVFVGTQGVPIANEFDDDDYRSVHFVIYASIHTVTVPEQVDATTGEILVRRRSETRTTPVGTIRIVPFPHFPHPRNGGIYMADKLTNAGELVETAEGMVFVDPLTEDEKRRFEGFGPYGEDRPTDMHNGKEVYVKLGRLSVVKEFRGHGFAVQLIRNALLYLRAHPAKFNPGLAFVSVEQMGLRRDMAPPKWNGLVCCHAQETAAAVWEKCGFVIDKAMGKWTEEGIPHVGMFMRLNLRNDD